MKDYTIIGDYFPEGDNIVRIGNEGKEIVAEGFVAFCVLSRRKPREYKTNSIAKEKELFKNSMNDVDFVHFLGEKRVKKIKKDFFWFKVREIFKI